MNRSVSDLDALLAHYDRMATADPTRADLWTALRDELDAYLRRDNPAVQDEAFDFGEVSDAH